MELALLGAVFFGIALLLFLILKLKLPAFIALLISSIATALMAGMDPSTIMETVKNGMGSTLGFVATVVGLGAIFGGILEHTGSAQALATFLISKTGESRAPIALALAGFLVSIPVFFDVGFIILFPLIVGLHQKTGRSLVHYAVPLLAGLAVSHAFMPPTPGPLAVAEILGIPLGWMVLAGAIAGLPAAYAGGIWYGKHIGNRLEVHLPTWFDEKQAAAKVPPVGKVLPILLLPILLIVANTMIDAGLLATGQAGVDALLSLLTHPFSALILSNVLAWYLLGRSSGLSETQLADISGKSLYPAGVIILVTGAGGVFKQVLMDTGAGKAMAEAMQEAGLGIIAFAFLTATAIRVLQGSATVAMITAAGLAAPLSADAGYSNLQLGAIGIAIASGATMLSHLNDSGFWLVKEFLRLSEKDGMRTWTVASSIVGLTGFVVAAGIFFLGG
jgi:Gnt-I system low-affinity gluconate transporter